MSHRLAQLHCYFASAVQLRHASEPHQIEAARSNLRSIANYCSNLSLAKAAANHLEACGYPEGAWASQFNKPTGAA